MSRFLQTHLSYIQHPSLPFPAAVLATSCLLAAAGCGEVTCPEPLNNVDGTCREVEPIRTAEPEPDVERCDGVDNDGDTEVDEDWPELGEACGEGAGVGECAEGEYVCAEGGMGVVCEGAVGPSDEVCDGKDNDCDGTPDNGPEETCDGEDNDCDGLVDEGVLSVKGEVFGNHATVAAVDGGFVVARLIADQLRVETYDISGNRTGYRDDIDSASETLFLTSDGSGRRVLVALGKNSFHVVEIHVDSDLVPIIADTRALHGDWDQATTVGGYPAWGVYAPPAHPRVLASPSRFLGYRDAATFALNPFAEGDLLGLAQSPTVAPELPIVTAFDVAGPFVVWEQGNNLRAGRLRDDGVVASDIDVARGHTPGISMGKDGPSIAYLLEGRLRLSELDGSTLQCLERGFCNESIWTQELNGDSSGPTGLAFDDATDTWFVVAGTELAVVGRGEDGAIVMQADVLDALGDAPNRVDVEVSGSTAAIVQAAKLGKSALTFLGCL